LRVIIAGGRDFNDYDLLKRECLKIFTQLKSEGYSTDRKNLEIISGEAKGADTLGKRFAIMFKLDVVSFPAKWNDFNVEKCEIRYNKYGNPYNVLAGHNRNEEMAKYASEDKELGVLLAFWDGKSTGTKNMIELAKKYGLKVFVVNY
jgi:hypothetical protein